MKRIDRPDRWGISPPPSIRNCLHKRGAQKKTAQAVVLLDRRSLGRTNVLLGFFTRWIKRRLSLIFSVRLTRWIPSTCESSMLPCPASEKVSLRLSHFVQPVHTHFRFLSKRCISAQWRLSRGPSDRPGSFVGGGDSAPVEAAEGMNAVDGDGAAETVTSGDRERSGEGD
jgi:hypothetical protein